MKTLYFFIGISLLVSCSQPVERRTESTIQMAGELDSLAQKARLNNNYPYFANHLLQSVKTVVQGLPYTMGHGSWLDYVLVLLLKGENTNCIEVIDAFLEGNQFKEIDYTNVDFIKVKAIAYLREGEIQNCINNHSGQSCIMPIKEDGIHQLKAPVFSAIEVYQQLMDFDSTDLQSKWFLNLCHQAAGQYPDLVLPKYLIPPEAFKSDIEFPVFPNVSMETNVAVNNHAGGASIEDFNNDGHLDIFTTSYSLGAQSKLFINDGMGSFIDETKAFGLEGLVGGLNNIHADFNNDGLIDIYIMRGAWLSSNGHIPNSLLINKGGKFSDETKASGLYMKQPTGTIAASDFNLDGHLDLFVGNESSGRHAVYPCQLFVNNGDGTFVDIAANVDLDVKQFVKGATWGDVNNDRLPDLYLSIYNGENKLFINRGGNSLNEWKFEEVAKMAGVNQPMMSFPTWFWDYDQDGWQDLMVIGYDNREPYRIASEVANDYLGKPFKGETPRLYKNNRDGTFADVTKDVGLDKLLYAMGGNFGDLNNDGYPDFYLGTGEFNIWASIPNRAFLNQNGKSFADVTTAGEFGQIQKGHGVAFGDLDNDGDQDIYHQVGGAAESDVFQNMLFQNPGFSNSWLTLRLSGRAANRSAIGAQIEVKTTNATGELQTFYHYVGTGGSFGANTLRAEIGLADAISIDEATIFWPDSDLSSQTLTDLKVNSSYFLEQHRDPIYQEQKSINLKKNTEHHEHHH